MLGKFSLEGIKQAARGVPKIEVTFDINENGILNVTASEEISQKKNQITITNNNDKLSPSEIERIVKEAEKYREEDDAYKKKFEAKNKLENYCYSIRNSLKD